MFQKAFTYSGTLWYPCKESWPRGPGFGLPLKGAVLKAVQVKSD